VVRTEGREMDDMRRLVFREERFGRLCVTAGRRERERLMLMVWGERSPEVGLT
jgi:hypothetical protein